MGLLAYPCQDGREIAEKTEKSTRHNHEDDGKDCHTCTPFCICSCCHVNTIVILKVFLEAAVSVPTIYISIYKENPAKEIILPIWQPPKL